MECDLKKKLFHGDTPLLYMFGGKKKRKQEVDFNFFFRQNVSDEAFLFIHVC